jgi:cytochrome c oxidase subunit I
MREPCVPDDGTLGRGGGPAAAGPAFRRELVGWAGLAIGALAIAGIFAFLLAFSRIPGIERVFPWPIGFFHKGLVIHVVFSFVVWFLAVFGALALLASERLSPRRRPLGPLGLVGVAGGVLSLPLLFIPAFLDRGEPTLNNYVPVIIDPLYYAGLVVLAIAVGCAALRLLAAARGERLRREGVAAAIAAAAIVYLLALLCFAAALWTLAGTPASHDFNEGLMWGGGHVLQFVNTLLLVAAWGLLAAPVIGGVPAGPLAAATALLLLAALPAAAFYLLFPASSAEQMRAFTWLQYALGPSAAVMAAGLLQRLPHPWPWRDPALQTLALSMLLFAVGGALGLFVDGADTRTPAHYHGVIAGVTLAFFGLFFFRFMPLLRRPAPSNRRLRLIVHLFAWGQLAACIGLFIAGGHGAPRKVAGDAQGLVDLVPMIGMGMNGLGGLIAVIGGILFVWTIGRALLADAPAATSAARVRSDLRS